MKTYPAMLNLSGRRVAVIGAGNVGLRKLRPLCDAGAKVRLITGKNFNAQTALPDGVEIIAEDFDYETSAQLLEGCSLIFACCNDRQTNSQIAALARELGIWVNAADQPEDCDFFCPAMLVNGDITIAIGTGGGAPSLSAEIKNFIARNMPNDMGEFAAALARIREELKGSCPDAAMRQAAMKKISSEEAHEVFTQSGEAGLRKIIDAMQGGH